ncbi:hypothetical protein [Streptomyces lonarensis]|uniref:Uncharacterized protein n=1 Tax=Streptomyces lonarensis TaxID=700599 RepID=A0A7X6D0S0_9ACTN|nr:hypothetical protein [Streptomyces lonarensis]NJQ06037.1 hypothetical protein [Streptomyces lonarensis]
MEPDRSAPTAVPFFATSWRGYRRREVDRYLAEQGSAIAARDRQVTDRNREIDRLRHQVAALNERIMELHAKAAEQWADESGRDGTAARVERLLETAAEEAAHASDPAAVFRRAIAEGEALVAQSRRRVALRAERTREADRETEDAAALLARARATRLPDDS